MRVAFPPEGGKLIVGMIHLPPLPGSPGWGGSIHHILDHALADAETLRRAGFDALLIENFGDTPFYPDRVGPETVAVMAVVAAAIRSSSTLPLGINVLRNDAAAALGIATAVNAEFIRVNVHTGGTLTDQGWIDGRAFETVRERERLRAPVAICADVLVKHAIHPPGAELAEVARDTFHRGHADVLIVTGVATGAPTDPARVAAVKQAVPGARVWIGSGLNAGNAAALLAIADGAIVGSALKPGGDPALQVDPELAARLVSAIRG